MKPPSLSCSMGTVFSIKEDSEGMEEKGDR